MRVFPWVGGVILVVVVGTTTAAALHAQNDGGRKLTLAQPVAAAAPSNSNSFTANLWANHHPMRTSPSQSPSTPATSANAPAAPSRASAPAPSQQPSIVIGSTQQALINRDRAAAGLPALTWSSCLHSVAVSNAMRLSHQGWVQPYHTNGPSVDLGCGLGHQAGENVGYWSGGINDPQLNSMFWASPEHKANILGPYRYVATAWAVASNGAGYIAVEFS